MIRLRSEHVLLLPILSVNYMSNIWVYTVTDISLIYDFSWSGVNSTACLYAPPDEIRFIRVLHQVIYCIMAEDPKLGSTYLSKLDLTGVYIYIWVLPELNPSVQFLVLRGNYGPK